jgi:hypothetical protein
MNSLEEFHCKLAIELHMSLVEVLNLPAWELKRWHEYFSTHPFTNDVFEYQLAQISYILYNSYSSERAELQDFIPKLAPQRDSQEVLREKLEVLRTIFGKEEAEYYVNNS